MSIRSPFPLLWCACLVHGWQGIAVIYDPVARQITPLSMLASWPSWLYGAALILASCLAVCAMVVPGLSAEYRLTLFAPQQIFMFLGSAGGAFALWNGYYGDHAVYPRAFIGPDQASTILLAGFHFWAMMQLATALPSDTRVNNHSP